MSGCFDDKGNVAGKSDGLTLAGFTLAKLREAKRRLDAIDMPLPDDLPAVPVGNARKEAYLDHFTPAEARAIGEIIELHWRAKLGAIQTGTLDELRDQLDFLCAVHGVQRATQAEIALWKAGKLKLNR